MKFVLFFSGILFTYTLQAQPAQTPLYYQGETDSLYSDILKENRKFFVYVPPTTRAIKIAEEDFPVMYLLDARSQFSHTSQTMNVLSGSAMSIPATIIVSILNTNRTRDLTPTHTNEGFAGLDDSDSGGGDAFLDFIEKELIPYIDQNYNTTPYRTLVGHSLGGLFTVHTLATRPHLFENYISLDPSLVWDNEIVVDAVIEAHKNEKLSGKKLFLASAFPETSGYAEVDSLLNTFKVPTERLVSYLHSQKDFHFKYANYPSCNHSDMVIPGTFNGLKFLFSRYYEVYQNMMDLIAPVKKSSVSNADFLEILQQDFADLSAEFGYEVKPREELINMMGYWMLQSGNLERGKMLFELNIANYPESANVYDSMGDYYMATKNKEKAIHFFQEALKRDENPQTKQKLFSLQN